MKRPELKHPDWTDKQCHRCKTTFTKQEIQEKRCLVCKTTIRKDFIQGLGAIGLVGFFIYLSFAWMIFEWRNPICNNMAMYKHFLDVVTFQKLDQFQLPNN